MRSIRYGLMAVATAAFLLLVPATPSSAQVTIGVNFGAEPNCPYGYFDYAPYNCAPDGYYGPQWFNGGAFIGAGHWFHGPSNFHGSVNNNYDPQHGYKGVTPARGQTATHRGAAQNFKGNESRNGRGQTVAKK